MQDITDVMQDITDEVILMITCLHDSGQIITTLQHVSSSVLKDGGLDVIDRTHKLRLRIVSHYTPCGLIAHRSLMLFLRQLVRF